MIAGGKEVGVSTSRCYSTHFRDMLSLCCIDVAHAEPDNQVTVIRGNASGAQREIRATAAPAPYKRDNRRTDVASLPHYI